VIFGGTGYKVLLLLHLLSVVIGFGPWMLNGLLGRHALSRASNEAKAVNAAALDVSTASQFAIYGVVVFGILTLVAAHKDTIKFSQGWVSVSFVLWIVIVGVLHGMALPAQRQLRDGAGDARALTQRFAVASGIINVAVIVAVILMIWTPGR